MSDVADRFVVVLDANVLYPFRVRDLLLRFAEAGLFRARWQRHILEEWSENLIKAKPHLEASVRSQLAAMEEAFPEACVEGYEDIIPTLDLPDEKDRHVLAAAIRAGAQLIVTENLKDFPIEKLQVYDVEAVSADFFTASTFELYPNEAMSALRTMRREYANPAMTQSDFVMDLMRVGLGQLAALVKKNIEAL